MTYAPANCRTRKFLNEEISSIGTGRNKAEKPVSKLGKSLRKRLSTLNTRGSTNQGQIIMYVKHERVERDRHVLKVTALRTPASTFFVQVQVLGAGVP